MTQRIPRKLHEQVFDSIKDMIRSGALEQGELLPSENKLAQQLGVSRVTVRWALKQLAEAGIIQTRKGKGSIVAVDWKGLLEEGDLARMEEALLRREDELVLAPLTGRVPGRVDFHTCLWASLHNPVMMRVWEQLAETSGSINRLPFVAPVNGRILTNGRWLHGHTFQAATVDGGAGLDGLSAGKSEWAFRVHISKYLQAEHRSVHCDPGGRLLGLWHLPGPVLCRERDGGADP